MGAGAMQFHKYHALGNDYLVMNPAEIGKELTEDEVDALRSQFVMLKSIQCLAFAGIFILFTKPLDILDPGFILTFSLSAGITS